MWGGGGGIGVSGGGGEAAGAQLWCCEPGSGHCEREGARRGLLLCPGRAAPSSLRLWVPGRALRLSRSLPLAFLPFSPCAPGLCRSACSRCLEAVPGHCHCPLVESGSVITRAGTERQSLGIPAAGTGAAGGRSRCPGWLVTPWDPTLTPSFLGIIPPNVKRFQSSWLLTSSQRD